jgi:hypothetical protein
MIEQQCDNRNNKGKNIYCNRCIKVADYFDVYKYQASRFDKGRLIGRINAYVWHDVIEYVKNNLLLNGSTNLNINCEKDFAYIDEKDQSTVTTMILG